MHAKSRIRKYIFLACITLCTGEIMDQSDNICSAAPLSQYIDGRESYINTFRSTGQRDVAKAREVEAGLRTLEKQSQSKELAQVLYELATIQRLTDQFETAIDNFDRAATLAKEGKNSELEFDALIGIARSHSYGTHDHGAAAEAFDRAAALAGETPTKKQRYQMADYLSQLQEGRGELEPALLNALEAIQLALDLNDDVLLFYAYMDTGAVLHRFAENCDITLLVDAKTNQEDDPLGACKRAAGSANSYRGKAQGIARKLGWSFLERQCQGLSRNMNTMLGLIVQKAKSDRDLFSQAPFFMAEEIDKVLVNEDFSAGGSALGGLPIGTIIDQAIADSQANNPRSIYLMGVKADASGSPAQALEYFKKAAQLLHQERESVLDFRQRGTAVENRPVLIRDLGLRLLALRQYEDAFAVFESLRSRGLEHLTTAIEKSNFTTKQRSWFAAMVQLDSLISAKETGLVQATIAGIEHSKTRELLAELNQLKARRSEMQKAPEYPSVLKALKSAQPGATTLAALKRSVDKTGIPVLLYWVTPVNVLVWAVSPEGVEVKTVFLPETSLVEKVVKVRESMASGNTTFDFSSARQLYTYLLRPFSRHLAKAQVIIIPQGPLVGLPFEALVREDGRYVADGLSVSYLPNAAFCQRSLDRAPTAIAKLAAIYDESLEDGSHEISRITQIKALPSSATPNKRMTAEKMIQLLGGTDAVHVLLHGRYNTDDPLQSTVSFDSYGGHLTAAELLAADWQKTQLAVFSSCESGVVKARTSNEQFGISWALLAGGVDQVLLSRWRVNEESNALWMETFYKALVVEKLSPALAANAAMRRFIRGGKQHPYYWAGPQVFGK